MTEPKLAIRTPFRDRKYISISLSLAPGVHASCTAPEQVEELKSAVRETGGEGGAKGSYYIHTRINTTMLCNQLYVSDGIHLAKSTDEEITYNDIEL